MNYLSNNHALFATGLLTDLAELPQVASIHADVEFGVPTKEGDCILTGVCRISEALPQTPQLRCRFARAELSWESTGKIRFFFPKNGMKVCTRATFFAENTFWAPMPCQLPVFVALTFQLPLDSRILPGHYPIERQNGGYGLLFAYG